VQTAWISVLGRCRTLGFENLTAFAEANWDADWIQLRARLGEPDVRPFQIYEWLRAEAVEGRQNGRFLRGALLRDLNRKVPNGWGPDDLSSAQSAWAQWAGALGDWASEPGLVLLRYLERVHPPGWKPVDPDDPVLVAAFFESGFPEDQLTSHLVSP